MLSKAGKCWFQNLAGRSDPSALAGTPYVLCYCSVLALLLQVQFVLTIIQTSCGLLWRCSFPLGWLYFQIGYMISLIMLFTNFYIQVNLTLS